MIPLGKIGAFLAVASALGTGVVFAWPTAIGDYPPLANIARVDASSADIRAIIVRGQIDGMWARYCDALRARNIPLANVYSGQMAQRKDDYYALAKRVYLTEPCP